MENRNLDRDKLDFANGKIGPLFRALFFPTLIGMIFLSALTLIDGIFVGQGVGAEGMAAVNIVAPIFMVATGIGLMFGIGASVIASIRLSENKIKVARIILTQAFVVGILLIGIICLWSFVCPLQVVRMLGCSPQLESAAVSYLLWLLPGLLFMFMQSVGMMLIRLDGSPKYAMSIQIVAAAVNIGLDWYMIFPLGWSVRGAAIATSMAYITGGLMTLVYFLKFSDKLKFYPLKWSVTSLLLTMRNIGYMARIGFATFLTELTMSMMMLTGNYMFISMLSEDGVAAFAITCYLFSVVFSISNAVTEAAQPIISFNYGAHRQERVSRTLRLSLFTAIICGLLVTLCLLIGTTGVVSLFLNPDEKAYHLAVEGLPLFALCPIFFAVNITFIGYYQSIERAMASTVYTLLRGVLFLVPCFIILPRIIGVSGLWLAIPTAELLTCIVIYTRCTFKHTMITDTRVNM